MVLDVGGKYAGFLAAWCIVHAEPLCCQRMSYICARIQPDIVLSDPPLHSQWSGVIIHPDDYDLSPLDDPTSLLMHLDLCLVDFDDHGAVKPQSLVDLIGSKDTACFTNAYDHDIRVDDWYYAFYSDSSDTTSAPNPIADIVKPVHHPPIRGRVLVVLNGPAGGKWETSQRIDDVELGRTLWWYLKSGHVVRDVFGERELRRYIRTLMK